ncbi:DNA polymerase beta [Pseudomassariella vexata]|uniref:DNA polymerase n=1 Tax=Pseudomassariella vexata TaxID=1141098 RepID=A0A1Y2EL10_9PEZI|nr:DNA polymerase beta [Pseudomassariella vexata]ORY71545.1 DNA polymerase beta [Pseudomassariella vexata]
MSRLDFPTIFLLPTHIEPHKLLELESQIPSLTYNISEAEVILGCISKRQRAIFELRRLKLTIKELPLQTNSSGLPPAKRRKITNDRASSTTSDSDVNENSTTHAQQKVASTSNSTTASWDPGSYDATGHVVKVVKLAWFTDSVAKGMVLPVEDYTIYKGLKEARSMDISTPPRTVGVLERARDDDDTSPASQRVTHHRQAASTQRTRTLVLENRLALIRETTSEHDIDRSLLPIPDFLHSMYSCQRSTPINPPNDAFIEQLKKVRVLRTLNADKVGVRAYSTSIASLAAYPHLLVNASDVSRLPGCGPKIAELYQQWKSSGSLAEIENANQDPRLSVLKRFYDIWGVAETTAQDFYNRGWRDLDDIVEYGWESLTRVQQIGVKYHDEFLSGIPRAEVESIAQMILKQANKVRRGFHMVIVGGYRRGKQQCGDVDVLLSCPDASATQDVIEEIVESLETDKYVTHTLSLSTRNSERGQAPLAWKGEDRQGSGFDTLDKAMVVWQNPEWDRASAPKNPNPHRRVDIIISPWKTAGCAVIGWSGGTTFERDLRRYCKKEKSLKFDSSGIRNRIDGAWVDLEHASNGTPAPDMYTAERRVFEGLGLKWRPPEERNTG